MIRTTLSLINRLPHLVSGVAQLAESSARLAVGVARQLLSGEEPAPAVGEAAPAPPTAAPDRESDKSAGPERVLQRVPSVVPAPDEADRAAPAVERSVETISGDGRISEEPELVAESADPGAAQGAGASLHVSEPWSGYRSQRAADVIDRLASEEIGALAVVSLFEQSNRNRSSVLEAVRRELELRERSGTPAT